MAFSNKCITLSAVCLFLAAHFELAATAATVETPDNKRQESTPLRPNPLTGCEAYKMSCVTKELQKADEKTVCHHLTLPLVKSLADSANTCMSTYQPMLASGTNRSSESYGKTALEICGAQKGNISSGQVTYYGRYFFKNTCK